MGTAATQAASDVQLTLNCEMFVQKERMGSGVVGGGALKVKVDSTPRLGLLVTNEGLRSWEIIAQSLFCVVGAAAASLKL